MNRGVQVQLHLNVRNTGVQKFFRRLPKAVFLIQGAGIDLRFDGELICMELGFCHMDSGFHNFAPQSAAALYRNHAANGCRGESCALRQRPRIGRNAIFIFQPKMVSNAVSVVDFLIRTFLLDHKYRNTQFINFQQLFCSQF